MADPQDWMDQPISWDEYEGITLSLLSDRGQEGDDFEMARKTHGKRVRAMAQPQPVKTKPTKKASR